MTHWCRTVILVCILAMSCSAPSETDLAIVTESEHWTSCIVSGGVGNILLSAETELVDGRILNTENNICSIAEDVQTTEELTVEDGRIRELRVRFSVTETQKLDVIYSAIHERLVSLYGNSTPASSYASWRAASTNGTLMEIELMDAQALFQVDAIIVHWQEHQDRLYED